MSVPLVSMLYCLDRHILYFYWLLQTSDMTSFIISSNIWCYMECKELKNNHNQGRGVKIVQRGEWKLNRKLYNQWHKIGPCHLDGADFLSRRCLQKTGWSYAGITHNVSWTCWNSTELMVHKLLCKCISSVSQTKATCQMSVNSEAQRKKSRI